VSGLRKVFHYAAVFFALLCILFPVVWFFALSLKSQRVAFQSPPAVFFQPTLQAYSDLLSPNSKYPLYLANSVLVAGFNTLLCLLLGLPAAYSFSRYTFAIRRTSMMIILITRMLPPIAMMVPFYLLANRLHLIDTRLSLILAYCVYNLPFLIWMMKGFFDDIPKALDESALIDGCSHWGALLRIVLPLSGPGLAVTSILNFVFSWNEFLWASVLTGMRSRTMTVGISAFWTNVSLEWAKIGAASTLFLLPPIILTILFRKYMVSGLTMGAVKG
jgi:multiple sugar transport system permease protein